MEIDDKTMTEWEDMYEEDDLVLQQLEEEILNSFKLKKIDSDNYVILIGSKVIVELKNCYYISEGFIQQVFETEKELFLEENYEEVKIIDLNDLLEQAIQNDWWNWRRQVAVYKGEIEKISIKGKRMN